MENKYVKFVSDEAFEKCMEETMKTYRDSADKLRFLNEREPSSILDHTKNTTDDFRALFDIYGLQLDLNAWKQYEINRVISYANRSTHILFHLNLLSHVDGWDWYYSTNNSKQRRIIKNQNNTQFIDIRNLHHSSDIGTQRHIWRNFEKILREYPDAICYRGYIISKNHEKGVNKRFKLNGKDESDQIREIGGDVIYQIVTGDKSALSDTFNAVRWYLRENGLYELTLADNNILDDHQKRFFN